MRFEQIARKPWENKKSSEFKDWLSRNASVPREQWDPDFVIYADQKKQAAEEKLQKLTATPEREDSVVFQSYLRRMDMSEEFLAGKRILDLGCMDGVLVRTCMERDLSQDVYGMDQQLKGAALDTYYDGHFFEGDFQKNIPIRDCDLILFKASFHVLLKNIPGLKEESDRNAMHTLMMAFDALSSSGELRVGPITRRLESNAMSIQGDTDEERVHRIVEELSQQRDIRYEFVPVDINAWAWNNPKTQTIVRNFNFDSVLIIKHAHKRRLWEFWKKRILGR